MTETTRMFHFLLSDADKVRLEAASQQIEFTIGGRGRSRKATTTAMMHAGAELLAELIRNGKVKVVPPAGLDGRRSRALRLRAETREMLAEVSSTMASPPSIGAMITMGCNLVTEAVEAGESVMHLPTMEAAGARQEDQEVNAGTFLSSTHPAAIYARLKRERRGPTQAEERMLAAAAAMVTQRTIVEFRGLHFTQPGEPGARKPKGDWIVTERKGSKIGGVWQLESWALLAPADGPVKQRSAHVYDLEVVR